MAVSAFFVLLFDVLLGAVLRSNLFVHVCSMAICAGIAVHYTWPFLLGDMVLRVY